MKIDKTVGFCAHSYLHYLQYLYRHHGDLLVEGLSLGVGGCCSLSAYWLTWNFFGWLSSLGCFPLCIKHTKRWKQGFKLIKFFVLGSLAGFPVKSLSFPILVGGWIWDLFLRGFWELPLQNKQLRHRSRQQIHLDDQMPRSACVWISVFHFHHVCTKLVYISYLYLNKQYNWVNRPRKKVMKY